LKKQQDCEATTTGSQKSAITSTTKGLCKDTLEKVINFKAITN
jgi:hypothetical protein